MSKDIKIRKGLDIRLKGEAEMVHINVPHPETFAVKPSDFHGVVPKLTVKAGEKVKAGTTIFVDKYNDKIKIASPVSGEVAEVVRGEKRKILEIRILADKEIAYEDFGSANPVDISREQVIEKMLNSGCWSYLKQRPFDVTANPADMPKAIFISGFDSSPLAPDYDFLLHGHDEEFQFGVDTLKKLTKGKVHVNIRSKATDATLKNVKGVELNTVSGPHPAGNVGVQIHHIDPLNKGEVVWVVNVQDVLIIGRLFKNGKYDASKGIALTGSEVSSPKYYKVISGTNIKNIIKDQVKESNVRYISGNPLTGTRISEDGYLGFYDTQITVLPEGNTPKFFLTKGWLGLGFNKFSMSKSYPSWLTPGKKYSPDTNINGEPRSFVVTGQYDKVFPMDIYPVNLVKSMMYGDLEEMESLGVYEVAPEDFALCEYVCTSKINVQEIVREGLDLVKQECT